MAHATVRNAYSSLADRINLFPQGAPPGKLLFAILKLLFSEKEAEPAALLPIKPFTAGTAARVWRKGEAETLGIPDAPASRGMLVDIESEEGRFFVMPPPMAGFFELSSMRIGRNYDQKILAELHYRYLTVEEDFIRNLFAGGQIQLGRVFVNEKALGPGDRTLRMLDQERASEVIRSTAHRGIGGCCCEALLAAKRFAVLNPMATTNFMPAAAAETCTGCGKCVEACPVEAMALVSAGDPGDNARQFRPSRRAHGHRARQAAESDFRQSGPGEPPGAGRHTGPHPEAAARQAADGEPSGEVHLPGKAPVEKGISLPATASRPGIGEAKPSWARPPGTGPRGEALVAVSAASFGVMPLSAEGREQFYLLWC